MPQCLYIALIIQILFEQGLFTMICDLSGSSANVLKVVLTHSNYTLILFIILLIWDLFRKSLILGNCSYDSLEPLRLFSLHKGLGSSDLNGQSLFSFLTTFC